MSKGKVFKKVGINVLKTTVTIVEYGLKSQSQKINSKVSDIGGGSNKNKLSEDQREQLFEKHNDYLDRVDNCFEQLDKFSEFIDNLEDEEEFEIENNQYNYNFVYADDYITELSEKFNLEIIYKSKYVEHLNKTFENQPCFQTKNGNIIEIKTSKTTILGELADKDLQELIIEIHNSVI